jgi:hypothetical protein
MGSRTRSVAAHLAELTSNQTYLDAALLSATFVRNFLLTPSNLIVGEFDIRTCHATTAALSTNNIGVAAHGWSVLADVTKDNQWRDLYVTSLHRLLYCPTERGHARAIEVIVAASRSTLWAGADGICVIDGRS